MKARILLSSLLFISVGAMAQVAGDDPVYVLDSVVVNQAAIGQVSPDRIGVITIAKGSKAVLKYGSQAENGVVYIETKPFARKRVNVLLSSESPAYDSLLRKYGNDSSFYFIVNGKPVTPTNETGLMTLDRKTFRSMRIISDKEVQDKYQVMDRKAGIVITSSEE
ncbi:hypothetical protein [Chitinophaga sp.]|uniref:hypothetical protein n=1 Tax=Chitinophaga sp. TaxID=1869181 RepID=UPI002C935321|nr:hypothetical protein [Chitinophaga sp.]HWV68649.1 hypothetical protein [Chitinophaga sp.]